MTCPPPPPQDNEHSTGRRNYDVELAEANHRLKSLEEEVSELRADIKSLVEAWQTAKGMTAFVKWASGIITGVAVVVAFAKGWKI